MRASGVRAFRPWAVGGHVYAKAAAEATPAKGSGFFSSSGKFFVDTRPQSSLDKPSQRCGAVAQLGERLNGIQEAVGSIPSSSTRKIKGLRVTS